MWPWRRRDPTAGTRAASGAATDRGAATDPARLARSARALRLRSRREAAGVLAGAWRAAFRGGGIEFEESRPYSPGDDLRTIDWNATARLGEPFVKRFREERDQTLLLLLDVSASMAFGSAAPTKAAAGARAAALVAAAAGHARDRVGLVAFDARVRSELAPARGRRHAERVVDAALSLAATPGGGTAVAEALARTGPRALGRRRGIVFLISDFRDPALLEPGSAAAGALAAAARRHDLVALALFDPRESALVDAGRIRLRDPERPERTLVLRSGDREVRARFAAAAAARRRLLERRLRRAGADVCWLAADRDPLRALQVFLLQRGIPRRGAAA